MVNELPLPWKFIFRQTNLLTSIEGTAFLVVPPSDKEFFSSFEALSKIYPIAKKLYPDTTSLLVVWGPEYEYVKNGELEIVDVKVKARDESN